MTTRPITEEDLHAYVDAALAPARRAEVEDYLRQHPDVAHRVQGYSRQREALRAMLAPIAEEPIPPELSLARLAEARRPRRLPWRAAAAAILLFSLGGASGWMMHGMSGAAPTGVAALAQEASYNYAVYSQDPMHPVEFGPADRQELVSWISRRLNTQVVVPDLAAAGYGFMGGRLVATAHGPAGLLMYDNGQGLRLAMLVRPMTIDRNTGAMAQSDDGPVTGFTWSRGGIGYSVVGAASPGTLHPIANEIRRQINLEI